MQIVEKRLDELQPYENNPRRHQKAVPLVANSIKEFGFRVPIIVDKNGVIVAGHTRYLAAKSLGIDKVPTVVADDLNPEQIKAFRIADNKTSESARWDEVLLSEEFEDLFDFDMTDFGFSEAEILELTIDDSDIGLFIPDDQHEAVSPRASLPPATGISRSEAGAYAERAESLVTKRVIIVYRTAEDETFIKARLGLNVEEPLGVIYDVDRLKGAEV